MEVTAESNDTFLAFRRLLYSLSRQLTAKDKHGIIFIHFYKEKVTLENASVLELLCRLESQGTATYSNPNGLLELMKDLKRNDLAGEVKEFMKKKKSKTDKKKTSSLEEENIDWEQEDDLELRATVEAALVQATVLLQQMEKLHVCTSGKPVRWTKIDCMVMEASQTSEALAERLRKAEAIGNRQQLEDNGVGAESVREAVDSKGYVNTFHSDRYIASLLSASVPLASLYNSSQRAGSLPAVSEIPPMGMPLEDSDNDEDDYETMNPGIVSGPNLWEEKRGNLEHRDYQIPRPHNIKTSADSRPVQYVDVVLPPRTNEDSSNSMTTPSSCPTTPSTNNTVTAASATTSDGRTERRHRLNSKGVDLAASAAKVASKRWTRIPSAEDDLAKQPIATRQKWAKPQFMEYRRNSNQLNNNWPRAYAKTDPVVELTSTIALSEKYPSTSAPVTIPVASPQHHMPLHGMEDNYTTLHPTQEHESGYKTVRPHPHTVSLPQLSSLNTKGGDNYYKPLEIRTTDSDQGYTSVQHK